MLTKYFTAMLQPRLRIPIGGRRHSEFNMQRDGAGYLSRGNYDERARSATYHDYPADQPFINDDYRRDTKKPIKAFPESNRQGTCNVIICFQHLSQFFCVTNTYVIR